YQIGDRIILLHSGEEGNIIDFINKQMVMVDVNGVQFPVYLDQVDFPYFKKFTEKNVAKEVKKIIPKIENLKKEKTSAKYKVGEGVWLSFLPVFDKDIFDDDVVEYFRVSLVNQTQDHLKFSYTLKYTGSLDFELSNEIFPLSDFYLHDITLESFNDSPRFTFEFTLKTPDKKRGAHIEAEFKIKAKQIFQKIEEIRKNQQANFSYVLFEHWPDKPDNDRMDTSMLSMAGYKIYDAAQIKSNLENAQSVVDLHIERLTDNWKKLSPYAMLDLQLKTFEKFYELSVLHRQPQLIIIHGVGTGRLRDEIHDLLRLKKEVKSFVNQYHHSYGYGATEIYFQY
ncbi:MAG: Smr/MutS family protein, partial [Chitinophagaceae bacterium]